MKALSLTLLGILGLVGCKDNDLTVELPDGAIIKYVNCDGGTVIPDMMPAPLNCDAEAGLSGKNLYCIDFRKTSISSLTSNGWSFQACTAPSTGVSWEISAGGYLQLNAADFTTVKGNCTFTLPPISGNNFNNYGTFAISVIHTVDISDGNMTSPAQLAQIYLGSEAVDHLVASTTSRQKTTQWIQTLSKVNFPGGAGSSYQPIFKLLAPVSSGGTSKGWQIQSIAIQGLP